MHQWWLWLSPLGCFFGLLVGQLGSLVGISFVSQGPVGEGKVLSMNAQFDIDILDCIDHYHEFMAVQLALISSSS